MLGEHFFAIDGAKEIPGVHDPAAKPRGALALSIAAVHNFFFTMEVLIAYI